MDTDTYEQAVKKLKKQHHLGVVKLDLKGSNEEVMGRVSYLLKPNPPSNGIVSGNETQEEIDKRMKALINQFPSVFTDVTGKFQGEPIKIQLKSDVTSDSASMQNSHALLGETKTGIRKDEGRGHQ